MTVFSITFLLKHVFFPPQSIVVLVDKMVRMQIIDCSAVVNWLFSKDMKDNFTKYVCGSLDETPIKSDLDRYNVFS